MLNSEEHTLELLASDLNEERCRRHAAEKGKRESDLRADALAREKDALQTQLIAKNIQKEHNSDMSKPEIKLIHELMVDIMGGLIPGFLFLFSILICIFMPMLCYHGSSFFFENGSYFRGWFWMVAFLTFLILSYVIGHVFYRSDIKKPDRQDLILQRKKFIKRLKRILSKAINKNINKKENDTQMLKLTTQMLKSEIQYLHEGLKCLVSSKEDAISLPNVKALLISCEKSIQVLNNFEQNDDIDSINSKLLEEHILYLLFPEEIDSKEVKEKGILKMKELSKPAKNIFQEYYNKFEHPKWLYLFGIAKPYHKTVHLLLTYYSILYMQNELGCTTEERCDFPYISYYKYLLKRGEIELLKYVKWNALNFRTKNKINKLKIDLQIHSPQIYSIINKNESHIRMAASSWYVAKLMIYISTLMIVITLTPIILELCFSNDSFLETLSFFYKKGELIQTYIIAFVFPFCMLLLLSYLKKKIESFIHYQRLREIFYTLYVYSKTISSNS